MTRRSFLAASASASFYATHAQAPDARPNVLFLITDQHSADAISANGNSYLHTPAIDSLIADGVSFRQSYATYPVCSPARSSWFTSRMPHETGVRDNGQAIAADLPTMGEHFRAAGYNTVYGGKWHLPKSFGDPRGFDQLIGGKSLGAQMDEPLATAVTDFLAAKQQKPFLLVASFMNPHDICGWIRAHKGTRDYQNLAQFPPAPANMAVDPGEPEYYQHHRTGGYNLMSQAVGIASDWDRDDVRFYLHSYYRMIEDVDRQIGRVLNALRASPAAQSTIVVLTSDHGEGMGAHRWAQKAAFWEEAVRVPFVVSGRGVERRGVVDSHTLVSGLDVLPTICDYARVAPPAGMRGVSLRPAIAGKSLDRPFVVSELSVYGGPDRQGRMLRTKRHKYVVFNGGARPEQLFDLELDPGEVYNLVSRPQAAETLNEHRTLLKRWVQETADDFRMPAV
jgi:arylsulfatase A-like enzyme